MVRAWWQPTTLAGLVSSPIDAVAELNRRRQNPEFTTKVLEYLGDDVPDYMKGEPVLCLSRYVATPNFETLRFLSSTEPLGLPVVITEDLRDKFVPSNKVKRALCKMPVCHRISQKEGVVHEQFQYVSVVHFNTSAGKKFRDITTTWGESLHSMHVRILKPYLRPHASVHSDTAWVDRNARGNLLEHYKRYLALFLVHGVLFEDYIMSDEDDKEFVETVVRPASDFLFSTFGVRPLIAELVPSSVESSTFWIAYPREVQEQLQKVV
jgi:hypothetical protein